MAGGNITENNKMFKKILRQYLKRLGFYQIDYGFSCGRHWMQINGKTICQSSGDDVWLRDEDIAKLVYVTIDEGKHWMKPDSLIEQEKAREENRRMMEEIIK